MHEGRKGTCLEISKSMALCIAEKEFIFFTSTFVPNMLSPTLLTCIQRLPFVLQCRCD